MTSLGSFGRRTFLRLAAASATSALMANASPSPGMPSRRIKAIAFDGFTVFDPRPVGELAEGLFPGNGAALTTAWRTRQFEYTWLRTLTGNYRDFWHVTSDALTFAAKLLKLDVDSKAHARLMQAFLDIKAWPDALASLTALKQSGLELVLLGNPTTAMLDGWIQNSGLGGIFGPHLSTDRVRAFKPDPRAYQMGPDALGLDRAEIAFAAFGGWDAAGAKAFGYPTFWVNRLGVPIEELGFEPDGIGSNLQDLTGIVAKWA